MLDSNFSKIKQIVLKDKLDKCFEYVNNWAYRNLGDLPILAEVQGFDFRWPGKHKHVHFWYIVATERGKLYGVGFNENPSIGWGFPHKLLHIEHLSQEFKEKYGLVKNF